MYRKGHQVDFLEEDDEPPPKKTVDPSKEIRLARVDSGVFVEWVTLGVQDGLSRRHVWSMISDDEDDDDKNIDDTPSPKAEDNNLDEYQDDLIDVRREPPSGRDKLLKSLAKEPYTLISYGPRGEAELIRLLFVAAGDDFEEWKVLEDELEMVVEEETPYQTLPVITKGPFTWGGSEAIARMLARKYNLMGETNHDHFIVEAMFERLCQLKRLHANVISQLHQEIKKRERLDWIYHQLRYVILPPAMSAWEKLIMSSKGPYIVESGMTLADLSIVDFLDQCTSKIHIKDLLVDFELLSDLITLVKKHPRIEAYLDEREDSDGDFKATTETE